MEELDWLHLLVTSTCCDMVFMAALRVLRIYSKTRVVSSTSVYVHIPATWRRHVVLCTHVAHETTQQYAYDPVCGYDTGSSRLW
jgi:hypothetical protein